MRVHFKALQSAIFDESKTPKRQDVGKDVGLTDKILAIIKVKIDLLLTHFIDMAVQGYGWVVA